MNLDQAIHWNASATPLLAKECKDHPVVQSTSYMDVYKILGTSGNSGKDPFWNWSVLGVIETFQGKLVVCPGDWIIEILPNHFVVLSDKEYKELKQNESTQAELGM